MKRPMLDLPHIIHFRILIPRFLLPTFKPSVAEAVPHHIDD
jgi:hypothetical protein